MKKCPVCGSTRFTEGPSGSSCKKCGYVNKRAKKIKKLILFFLGV